jgi:hypothetical protein
MHVAAVGDDDAVEEFRPAHVLEASAERVLAQGRDIPIVADGDDGRVLSQKRRQRLDLQLRDDGAGSNDSLVDLAIKPGPNEVSTTVLVSLRDPRRITQIRASKRIDLADDGADGSAFVEASRRLAAALDGAVREGKLPLRMACTQALAARFRGEKPGGCQQHLVVTSQVDDGAPFGMTDQQRRRRSFRKRGGKDANERSIEKA